LEPSGTVVRIGTRSGTLIIRVRGSATLACEMDAAVWTAIAVLAAMSLGTLFYLEARIDSLAAKTDTRFDHVDARFDPLLARMDARFDHMEERFDALSARLDAHLDQHAS
jgi:hypothetical protein